MKKQMVVQILCILIVSLLTGCKNTSKVQTDIAPVTTANTIVTEGHIIPRENLYLSFLVRGKISEILVKQGDQVTEGQILIRLGDNQQAQAALTAARLELISAQQASDTLARTADLARAQALIAYIDAQKAKLAAQLVWDRLELKNIQTSIDYAQEVVDARKSDLDAAQTDFEKYKDLPEDDNTRINSENKLTTAQTNYDDALRLLLNQTNRRDIPRAALDSAVVINAEAERTYNNSLDGPDADKLSLVQARLENAFAQVAAAQNALDSYELKAPFNGIVAEVNVALNQMIGPEIWAVVVIDPSQWYVDTSDLTEYEVVNLKIGDTAEITIDALLGSKITGIIEKIAMAPKVQAGDIIYTVRLRVDEPAPQIKWGMTVEVTFPFEN